MVNEDANAKLIRELKEEVQRLRELLRSEGIEVGEGKGNMSTTEQYLFSKPCSAGARLTRWTVLWLSHVGIK